MGKAGYISVEETARAWRMSERSVRNYCSQGRIAGAVLEGKTWRIPAGAEKPGRKTRHSTAQDTLLATLWREKEAGLRGGIYHRIQIEMTYNSNHIEGSRLTHDQTRHIFETTTLGVTDSAVNVDDIIETVNHFRCIDLAIEGARSQLSESLIKQLHLILKSGTTDCRKPWFKVGDYKMLENEVGGSETAKPADVAPALRALLAEYNARPRVTLDDILDFHVRFERIHPFQDGNGRVGRLIMLKECLRHNIVPFIITEELKLFYYRGIKSWDEERGYLRDTCLSAQDEMKSALDYFGIEYE